MGCLLTQITFRIPRSSLDIQDGIYENFTGAEPQPYGGGHDAGSEASSTRLPPLTIISASSADGGKPPSLRSTASCSLLWHSTCTYCNHDTRIWNRHQQ